jgi:hypothetical protein
LLDAVEDDNDPPVEPEDDEDDVEPSARMPISGRHNVWGE